MKGKYGRWLRLGYQVVGVCACELMKWSGVKEEA